MLARLFRHLVRGTREQRGASKPSFLAAARGVIHIGANSGQERALYASYGLPVVWVEPVPEVFEALVANIREYPLQRALRYLVTDQDDVQHRFHVANNDAQSSSMLELAQHRDIWPDIRYERTITLGSITLKSLVEREAIDTDRYDALVLDTQGSELRVLEGAGECLSAFRFVQVEVADFEAYAGCCRLGEVEAFMRVRGYATRTVIRRAAHPRGGNYYDVVYEAATETPGGGSP